VDYNESLETLESSLTELESSLAEFTLSSGSSLESSSSMNVGENSRICVSGNALLYNYLAKVPGLYSKIFRFFRFLMICNIYKKKNSRTYKHYKNS
jgi:hypothetical protein